MAIEELLAENKCLEARARLGPPGMLVFTEWVAQLTLEANSIENVPRDLLLEAAEALAECEEEKANDG